MLKVLARSSAPCYDAKADPTLSALSLTPDALGNACSGGFADSSIHVRQLRSAAAPQQPEAHEAAPSLGPGTTVLRGHTGAVTSLSHSPCSQLLASGSADCSARLWSPSLAAGLAVFRWARS